MCEAAAGELWVFSPTRVCSKRGKKRLRASDCFQLLSTAGHVLLAPGLYFDSVLLGLFATSGRFPGGFPPSVTAHLPWSLLLHALPPSSPTRGPWGPSSPSQLPLMYNGEGENPVQQPDGIANTGVSSWMCFAGGEPNHELPPSDGYEQELWHQPVPPVPPQGPSPHQDVSIQPLAPAEVAALGMGPATSPGGLSSEPSPQVVPPAGRHQPGFSAEMPVPKLWQSSGVSLGKTRPP